MATSTSVSPLESPVTPSSPMDPSVFTKEAPVSDYYTIAILAQSPVDNNDMCTSFSNPNYTMMTEADNLNSNNLPQQSNTQYSNGTSSSLDGTTTDNSHIYEDICSPVSSSSILEDHVAGKSRKKYAQMDLNAMGMDLPSADHHKHRMMMTPDSVASIDSEGRDSACDITSPNDEKTSEILRVEHTDDDETPYAEWKPKGFLGYYASLERSKQAKTDSESSDSSHGGAGRRSPDEEESEAESRTDAESSTAGLTPNTPHDKDGKNEHYDDKTKVINSPDSNDSGIQADVQHIHGPLNNDIYAVVQKPASKATSATPTDDTTGDKQDDLSQDEDKSSDTESLPTGWEKHEDDDGPYYWHIKSGTIQRDPPPPPPPERQYSAQESTSGSECGEERAMFCRSTSSSSEPPVAVSGQPTGETTGESTHLDEFEDHAFKYAAESIKSMTKQREDSDKSARSSSRPSSKDYSSAGGATELPIRFAVRSLGWVRVAEEDLTPEKSSKAVNKCIVDLSLGRNDINDVVGRWGDGKDLYMDLDDQNLVLIDPQDVSVLNVQPIQSIRVWGVGRDNGRDFAYVARDRVTRKHMCHVFRCDTPARQIANTLRDICQRIMLERSRSLAAASQNGAGAGSTRSALGITRPNNLPVGQTADGQKITFESLFNNTSFPTPMEEPKKVIRCHYLGTAQVMRPTASSTPGIEMLNGAAEKVYSRVPPEKWVFVSVAVAPSTITISEHGKPENILSECRVRFLSFMGIAQTNVKLCTFIMHTAQDQFVAHVFHCEPSAGALCKTIEAACKLRYQKCLDSSHNQMLAAEAKKQTSQPHSKGLGASLKQGVQNVFGNLGRSRKSKS